MPRMLDEFPGMRTAHPLRAPRLAACCVLAAAFLLLGGVLAGRADDYPSRPIRLMVPTAAGSSLDVIARLLQPHLERQLRQSVIIDNRAGASTMIGTDAVAKAAPDGYTLLIVPRTFTLNAALNTNAASDPEKDFAPVSLLTTNPLWFLINAKLPARDLAQFVALAKAQPGKLNYASTGASSQGHLLTELWTERAGIRMQHIPYRGGGPAALSVATGETEFVLLSPTAIWHALEAGTVRALATGGTQRDPKFPDLPTAAESGFPGFEAVQWVGLATTGGTPAAVVQRISEAVNGALREPDVLEKLATQGTVAAGSSPEEFSALIATEIRDWKKLVKRPDAK